MSVFVSSHILDSKQTRRVKLSTGVKLAFTDTHHQDEENLLAPSERTPVRQSTFSHVPVISLRTHPQREVNVL
jgi:hypothetical protein